MICHPLLYRLAAVVPVCILMVVGPAQAQDSPTQGIRVSEWRRERMPLNSAIPEYPEDARRERLEGEARVCFAVNARGEVIRPRIRSSTHRIFNRPTLKAIRASTFESLEAGELESPFETCRTYRFRLDRLDPLYVAPEAAVPETAGLENAASLVTDSASPDPTPDIELGSLALARTGAQTAIRNFTFITEAGPLPPEAPVCMRGKRPGTRIEQTFCNTPGQQALIRSTSEETYRGMQREGYWLDQMIQQALMKNGYPKGAGLGPR